MQRNFMISMMIYRMWILFLGAHTVIYYFPRKVFWRNNFFLYCFSYHWFDEKKIPRTHSKRNTMLDEAQHSNTSDMLELYCSTTFLFECRENGSTNNRVQYTQSLERAHWLLFLLYSSVRFSKSFAAFIDHIGCGFSRLTLFALIHTITNIQIAYAHSLVP